jgi:hypothetical protein
MKIFPQATQRRQGTVGKMRSALFRGISRRRVLIVYRCFRDNVFVPS